MTVSLYPRKLECIDGSMDDSSEVLLEGRFCSCVIIVEVLSCCNTCGMNRNR